MKLCNGGFKKIQHGLQNIWNLKESELLYPFTIMREGEKPLAIGKSVDAFTIYNMGNHSLWEFVKRIGNPRFTFSIGDCKTFAFLSEN
jgi:hypothetical protein